MLTTIAQTKWWSWLPERASGFADWVDPLFYFEVWLSVVLFVGIGGTMFYFAWKYHRKSPEDHPHGAHHNNTLEIIWSVIPLVIVMIIFVWGFNGFMKMVEPPTFSTEIVVTAQRWSWSFQYPNGAQSSMEDGLWVPVDQPVRIVLRTPLEDVIHSFYVPAFRIKKDAVPGRYNFTWFEANKIGDYPLYCAEYCGQQHSQMRSVIHVVSEDEYYDRITEMANFLDNDPPAVAGEKVFKIKGCSTCHSVEGRVITGPPLDDKFGSAVTLADGSQVLVDENYIAESINNPSAKIAAGYQDQMTVAPVSEKELNVLIAYLKSISEHYAGSQDAEMGASESPDSAQGEDAAGEVDERPSP